MITNSIIGVGDQLGAQMGTLANLLYLGNKYNQKVVFYEELKNWRRGIQPFDVFDINDVFFIRNSVKPDFIQCEKEVYDFEKTYKNPIIANRDKTYYNEVCALYPNFKLFKGKNGIKEDERLSCISSGKDYDIQSGYGMEWVNNISVVDNFIFKKEIFEQSKKLYKEMTGGGV